MRFAPLIFLVALCAGLADASPAKGEITRATDLTLDGAIRASATGGILDLTPAVLAGEPLSIAVSGAHGERVTYRVRHVEPARDEPIGEPSVEPVDSAQAIIAHFECAQACKVALIVEDGGALVAAGNATGRLAWLGDARAYCGYICSSNPPNFEASAREGSLLLGGADHPAAPDAVFRVEGRATLFMENARASIGGLQLDARADTGPADGGILVPGVVYEARERHVRLALDGASFVSAEGSDALWLAPQADVAIDGTAATARASGAITWAGTRHDFHDAPLEMSGAFRLGALSRDATLVSLEAAPEKSTVAGDVTALRIGSERFQAASAAPVAPATGIVVGVGMAAALLAARLLLPLYTRIRRDRVLANANRRALFEAVRASPGITTSEAARQLGLARVVVTHHLRMLSTHRLTAARRIGRETRHYAVEDLPAPDEAEALAALMHPKRRAVALALLGAGGAASAAQIGRVTRCSRRLAAYHLARLERAGLVEARTDPLLFEATPRLASALRGGA